MIDAVELGGPQQPLGDDPLCRGLVVRAVFDSAVVREVIFDDGREPVRVFDCCRQTFVIAGLRP